MKNNTPMILLFGVYVFSGDIDSEMRIGSNKILVTLVTGKVWNPVYFTSGSASLTTQESMPSSGRLIESKFEIKIPGVVTQHKLNNLRENVLGDVS